MNSSGAVELMDQRFPCETLARHSIKLERVIFWNASLLLTRLYPFTMNNDSGYATLPHIESHLNILRRQ